MAMASTKILKIPYQEVGGSPRISINDEGIATAEQTYVIAWDDVDRFIAESFPQWAPQNEKMVQAAAAEPPVPVDSSTNLFNSAVASMPSLVKGTFPLKRTFPGRSWLFTKTLDFEAFDPNNPGGDTRAAHKIDTDIINRYPEGGAVVTIGYSSEEPTNPSTYLTQRITIGAEYMRIPVTKLKAAPNVEDTAGPAQTGNYLGRFIQTLADGDLSGALKTIWIDGSDPSVRPTISASNAQATQPEDILDEDMRVHKVIPTIEHQFSWKAVSLPPWQAIRNCIGKVNSNEFEGIPPETLLFLGCEAQREHRIGGIRPWSLNYRFSEKRISFDNGKIGGWQHFYRPLKGRWETVFTGPDGDTKVYSEADMADLFKQGFKHQQCFFKEALIDFNKMNSATKGQADKFNRIASSPGFDTPQWQLGSS